MSLVARVMIRPAFSSVKKSRDWRWMWLNTRSRSQYRRSSPIRPDHMVRMEPTTVAATSRATNTSDNCQTIVKSVGVPGGCGLMPSSIAFCTRRGPYWSANASNITRSSTPRIGQRFGQSRLPSENGFCSSSTTWVNGTSWSSKSGSFSSRPSTFPIRSGGMPANCWPGALPHTAPCALGGGPKPPPKPPPPPHIRRSPRGSGGRVMPPVGPAPLPGPPPSPCMPARERVDARLPRRLFFLVAFLFVLALVLLLRVGEDLAVERHVAHELVVAAVGDDAPTIEHHHAVGEADRREPVGDDQRGAPVHERAQRAVDLELALGVDRAGGVVEHEDARVDEQGAGDGDALALTARQRVAALADDGVVAVGQLQDEVVRAGCPRRRLDLLERRVGSTERDVVADRLREEERLVGHHPDVRPQAGDGEVADVLAVDAQRAGGDVVEARDESRQRSTSRSRCARRARPSRRGAGAARSGRAPGCRAGTRRRRRGTRRRRRSRRCRPRQARRPCREGCRAPRARGRRRPWPAVPSS